MCKECGHPFTVHSLVNHCIRAIKKGLTHGEYPSEMWPFLINMFNLGGSVKYSMEQRIRLLKDGFADEQKWQTWSEMVITFSTVYLGMTFTSNIEPLLDYLMRTVK